MRPDAPPIHPAAGRHKHRATPARRGWLRGRHRRPVAVAPRPVGKRRGTARLGAPVRWRGRWHRSEEHTSELQSLMRISYAVFCLKKKRKKINNDYRTAKL